MELAGKVAVVTGSTKGIGLAVAEALHEAGARVVVSGRDPGRLEAATQSLSAATGSGERVAARACDVRRYDEVQALLEFAVERFGGLDVLVNNAGVGHLASIEEISLEQWSETVDTNLTGVFYCCREAVPHLVRRGGGHIVNMGSRAGVNAFPGGVSYNATKFGLIGLSEALILDLRRRNIRLSYILPGPVGTDFMGEAQPWHLEPEDVAKAVVDVLRHEGRALASRVELRPSRPPEWRVTES